MKIGSKEFDLENKIYIMGILNVTPDSFSDGGQWNHMDRALKHVEDMVNEGASIIDIGGESTKPGYTRISDDEEIERVVPFIESIKSRIDVPISIDTYKAAVAEESIKAGAHMINDIWGFKSDENMAKVAAKFDIPCCIMHNRDREKEPYTNLILDVISDLKESIDIGMSAGVSREKLIIDPGIGFGKSLEENLKVMKNIGELKSLGCPVLLGTSRKSMIGLTLDLPVDERVEGTLTTSIYGALNGCAIVRVHDVKENYRAIKMMEAILKA